VDIKYKIKGVKKMKYELYIKKDEKYDSERVKFENGEDYCVSTDKEGKKYFPIPNVYINNPENDPFKMLFCGRIKDAITAIKEGHGDVLSIGGIFGACESVYRFVDREYGEELRQKTIERFKNTEFGYSLKFGYLALMSGSRFVSKDNKILSIFEDQNNYKFFNTEEDAEKFRKYIIDEATKLSNNYLSIKENGIEEQIKESAKFIREHTIFSEIAYAIIRNQDGNNCWNLEVVQAIKQ
jgi:hypothetical protein